MEYRMSFIFLIWNANQIFGFNYTQFENPTGAFTVKAQNVFISYNSWKLLYYFDLYDIHDNIEKYKSCINKMADICQHIPNKNQCESIIEQHKDILNRFDTDIQYFKDMQSDETFENNEITEDEPMKMRFRIKRAPFGFWGTYFLNPLFGVMDEEQAHEITEKINEMIKQEKQQKLILENNMSIVKQTLRISNQTFGILENNINDLNNYLNEITSNISSVEKEIKSHIDFKYMSATAMLMSLEQNRYLSLIKQALKNTLRGDFTEFISYNQLLKDLKDVAETYEDTTYTILNRLKDIQNVATIKGTISNKRLTLELDVPVIMKQQFKLHRIIPLPIRHKDKIMLLKITNDNYLVDSITENYIPIQPEILNSCKIILENNLLCFPQSEIYFSNRSNCISNLLFENTPQRIVETCEYSPLKDANFIKQISENLYFISMKNNVAIRENCIKQGTTLSSINSTGLLRMNTNCEIIINGMRLLPKSYRIREQIYEVTLTNTLNKIIVSNLTAIELKLNKMSPPKNIFLNHNDNFQKLVDESDSNIQKIQKLKDISYLHYDTMMGTSTWIVIIIIIIVIIRCILRKYC